MQFPYSARKMSPNSNSMLRGMSVPILVGLALSLALIGNSWGQSQQPSPSAGNPDSHAPGKTNADQNPSGNDQHGADQPSLTLKVIGVELQTPDRAANTLEGNRNKFFDWQTAILGGIGFLQLIAFIVQAAYMRSSAKEMRATTEATKEVSQEQLKYGHKIERAYISGGGTRALEFGGLSAHQTPIMRPGDEFEFHVNNYGKTAGTLYKVGYGFCDETAIPDVPSYTFDYWRDQITPGRGSIVVFRRDIPPQFTRPVVFGRFYYRTIFDTCHSSGFIYRIVKGRNSEPISMSNKSYIQEQDESCDDADPI